jgi:hypothetical protein
MKEAIEKSGKRYFIFFCIAAVLAIVFFAIAVILALKMNYAPAIVSAVFSAVLLYCAPIYYNSAANRKAYAKILDALNEGVCELDSLSEKTGIRRDFCEKLLVTALEKSIIQGFILTENGKIEKK